MSLPGHDVPARLLACRVERVHSVEHRGGLDPHRWVLVAGHVEKKEHVLVGGAVQMGLFAAVGGGGREGKKKKKKRRRRKRKKETKKERDGGQRGWQDLCVLRHGRNTRRRLNLSRRSSRGTSPGESFIKTERGKQERGGGRVYYVLEFMFVTFPTCQAERLPLKSPAP